MVEQKIKIIISGYEHKNVDQTVHKIVTIARSLDSKVYGPIPLPTKKEIFTVLRGVFRHKDAREQFERRIHKRLLLIKPNSKTMDSLRTIQLPSSVNLVVKKDN